MDLSSLSPMPGSRTGRTLLGRVGEERCAVRLFLGDEAELGLVPGEVEAALLRLVRGLVPVPDVWEVRRRDPAGDLPGLLVTGFVEAVAADVLVPDLDEQGRARVGAALGGLVATLAGMPRLRPGPFVDAELGVGSWPDAQERDLPERCVLVHGRLDLGHVLLDPGTLEVRAVTGWSAAHAGDVALDLGTVLGSGPAGGFRDAVLLAWSARHGALPEQLALP